jgi:hypothetical protein
MIHMVKFYAIENTYLGTCGKNVSSLFAIILEIHYVEDKVFD